MQLDKIIRAARGDSPVDLLLKNIKLINVVSGEIYPTDIAIDDQLIVGIGNDYEAKNVIDLTLRLGSLTDTSTLKAQWLRFPSLPGLLCLWAPHPSSLIPMRSPMCSAMKAFVL